MFVHQVQNRVSALEVRQDEPPEDRFVLDLIDPGEGVEQGFRDIEESVLPLLVRGAVLRRKPQGLPSASTVVWKEKTAGSGPEGKSWSCAGRTSAP